MKKKISAMILTICMLLSISVIAPVSATAADTANFADNGTTDQQSDVMRAKTLAQLKSKFPNNRYWNHVGGSNNPDKTTATPCTHHGNCGYYPNNCLCNSYNSAIQCRGYVYKLINEIYGQDPLKWSKACRNNPTQAKKYLNSTAFKPGDVVRWNNDGHQILITAYNSSTATYTYTDCNSDGRCIIKWGRTITKSALLSKISGYFIAPYRAS